MAVSFLGLGLIVILVIIVVVVVIATGGNKNEKKTPSAMIQPKSIDRNKK